MACRKDQTRQLNRSGAQGDLGRPFPYSQRREMMRNLMTRQTFFNSAVAALLALLVLNTASIARSLRRIERIEHHRLVGWHLISPPMAPIIAKYARSIHLDENPAAPLSQWTIVETFHTEEECEAHRHPVPPGFFYGVGGGGMPIITGQWNQCIATDDPRLKGKSRAADLTR